MRQMINVRNTATGRVGAISEHVFDNPAIIDPELFVLAEEGDKPYVAELYQPRSAAEYLVSHPEGENEDDVEEEDNYDSEDEDK